MDLDSYVVTDDFFGAPFLDADEERAQPVPHRYLHGGFDGTDTRFSCYLPPADSYHHRLFHSIEGGMGGLDGYHGTPVGDITAMGILTMFHLGGLLVESNQGHIGPTLCAKAGDDSTIYGYRASAETSRLAKHLAAQVYGRPPERSYIIGGGGGGHRAALAFAMTDVWDGALPFDAAGEVGEIDPTKPRVNAGWGMYSAWLDALRLLGDQVADVVDATEPGGSGDPFVGLDSRASAALATMYRVGFPRGCESMIPFAGAPMSVWAWSAGILRDTDPGYLDAFWSVPGHAGHDDPGAYAADLVEIDTTVVRVYSGPDVLADPRFVGTPAAMRAGFYGPDAVIGIELDPWPTGLVLGANVEILDGAVAGRRLVCNSRHGNVLFADGVGEAGIERFRGVLPGDRVRLVNRDFLAFCHYYRHHASLDVPGFESLFVDGRPIYPQRPPIASPPSAFGGTNRPATWRGKLLWVQHGHDSNVWPAATGRLDIAVREAMGADVDEHWCLRWTEHADYVPPILLGGEGTQANARLVDWRGHIEQALADLVAWVERGVRPSATSYRLSDGCLTLPEQAAERGGIQPVVRLTADGAARAEVAPGTPVELTVEAEVPSGQGAVIHVEWDLEGTGTWTPAPSQPDGTSARLVTSMPHSYPRPGTYFVGVRVTSHREGEVGATFGRVTNLARARVVVT